MSLHIQAAAWTSKQLKNSPFHSQVNQTIQRIETKDTAPER